MSDRTVLGRMGRDHERRWTLCANKRRGLEGAPIVLDGPRIDLYDQVPVVPEAEVERLREELRIARWDADVPIRELRAEVAELHAKLERVCEHNDLWDGS
jgi:hypothetical protein